MKSLSVDGLANITANWSDWLGSCFIFKKCRVLFSVQRLALLVKILVVFLSSFKVMLVNNLKTSHGRSFKIPTISNRSHTTL
jgi:hypothetical protein